MAGGKKTSPGTVLANIAGWAGGWALAQYSGANLVVPACTMLLVFIVFAKTPLRPRHFGPAIAVILGPVRHETERLIETERAVLRG